MGQRYRLGIVGARGYVGAELIRLVADHPALDLAWVASRQLDGQPVSAQVPQYRGDAHYRHMQPADLVNAPADAIVLALPNGQSGPWIEAIDAGGCDPVVVDVSADWRFDDRWHYGLPELTRKRAAGARRISNPGCYATAMQLALAPMRDYLARPAQCFGVSGYSGAGTTPSDRNDPEKLRDNLMPYTLVGHTHEREVTRHLGLPVEFMPHVAPHFRGITMTVNMHLKMRMREAEVVEAYRERYVGEPLVRIVDSAPWVSQIAGHHHCAIGGLTLSVDGRRLVVVAALDNLLKGAATQCVQNLNIALGRPEFEGIPT